MSQEYAMMPLSAPSTPTLPAEPLPTVTRRVGMVGRVLLPLIMGMVAPAGALEAVDSDPMLSQLLGGMVEAFAGPMLAALTSQPPAELTRWLQSLQRITKAAYSEGCSDEEFAELVADFFAGALPVDGDGAEASGGGENPPAA